MSPSSTALTGHIVVLGHLFELLDLLGTVLLVAVPFSLNTGTHSFLDYLHNLLIHLAVE